MLTKLLTKQLYTAYIEVKWDIQECYKTQILPSTIKSTPIVCICSSGNLENISRYLIFYTSALRNYIFPTADSQSCKGIVTIHIGNTLFHLGKWNFFHATSSSPQGTCKGTLALALVMEPGDRNLLSQFAITSHCSVWENSINKSRTQHFPWRRESHLKWL